MKILISLLSAFTVMAFKVSFLIKRVEYTLKSAIRFRMPIFA
ncbi:hypothetical protein QUF56_07605 [Ureibacillus composti]|nr:hypothetical protein [Ureibacillus composti]